jgi:hypothetical protein
LRFLKQIAETIQKPFLVHIVAKNLPPGNASGDHMMQRTRGIYPSLAGHTSTCIKIQPAKQVERPRMILFPLLSRAISRASFEVKSVPLFRLVMILSGAILQPAELPHRLCQNPQPSFSSVPDWWALLQ